MTRLGVLRWGWIYTGEKEGFEAMELTNNKKKN